MKKPKEITPQKIWNEYLEGEDYHSQIKLHETVKKNEEFYEGEQWNGVNAPDLEKPVINIFKRAVTYLGSQIISDDVGISLEPFCESEEASGVCKILSEQIGRIVEITKAKTKNREIIKDAAVTGDGALYAWFDPEKGESGELELETIDNEKVIFRNPFEHDVQRQKSIIIVKRMMLDDAKELAAANGVPEDEIKLIMPDDRADYSGERKDIGKSLVTVLLRFWKEDGTVWFSESTQDVFIRKPVKTGAKLYHLAWMPWEKRRDSYHGSAVMTPYIQNQIYVNKMWALAMVYSSKMAWPQRFYDATKIRGNLSNKVGQAVGVAGDPKSAVWFDSPAGNMSAQVLELVDRTIRYTRESLGVTDAALGDIRPENTSAIIAAAEQSAAPLIFQKLGNHQLWEDLVHIFLDIIREMYGLREIYTEVVLPDGSRTRQKKDFDFSALDYDAFDIKVNIGSATYWSQLMQVQTMDAFFKSGIIDDALIYLEHIPEGYVSEKEELIRELREKRAENTAMSTASMEMSMGGNPSTAPTATLPLPLGKGGNFEPMGQLGAKISGI
ncbi:MAG: hypothetical protein IJO22_06130 [Oscillospiraceae bacterium]|nr:hypothetical protein [Oscillospiraceae bacterium]